MKSTFYYNDIDVEVSKWTRALSENNVIPDGEFDSRSIQLVQASDVRRYSTCHFFAGIGGWAHALRIAGWHDDWPVWTGSCPCQPYSNAGRQEGDEDERNLWPEFFRLIRECRPDTIFGEQVPGAIGFGWLDGISADLEQEGYTVGAIVLGAHSVKAPQKRQRLYWVSDTGRIKKRRYPKHGKGVGAIGQVKAVGEGKENTDDSGCGEVGRMADAIGVGCDEGRESDATARSDGFDGNSLFSGMGNTDRSRFFEHCRPESIRTQFTPAQLRGDFSDPWREFDIIPCRDGKYRRLKSGVMPLAYGISGRVALLRGYGNAIVPQVAATFIRAFMERQ